MGNAYQIECHECGYSTQVYVGSARNDLEVLTRSFAEIQHGAAGRAARAFLRRHQQTYITTERRLYECPACGRVQPRIAACLHSGADMFTQRYFCESCNSALACIPPEALTGRPCPECGKPLSADEPVPFDIIPATGEVRPSPAQRKDTSPLSADCLVPIPAVKGSKELRYWIASRDNMPIGVNADGLPLFAMYADIDTARTDLDAYVAVRGETDAGYGAIMFTCPLMEAGLSQSDISPLIESLRALAKPLGDTFGDNLNLALLHGGPDMYISGHGDIDAPLLSTLWLHPLMDDHFELVSLLLKLRWHDGKP